MCNFAHCFQPLQNLQQLNKNKNAPGAANTEGAEGENTG